MKLKVKYICFINDILSKSKIIRSRDIICKVHNTHMDTSIHIDKIDLKNVICRYSERGTYMFYVNIQNKTHYIQIMG